ncbi:MAG: hypothetical protein QNJ94_01260 [Alphaproteobacteria bacterium]|nr:hypothetical protein [Alphaproteobacteria bacterium]
MNYKKACIRYLIAIGLVPLFMISCVFGINYLVDPLWYFRGNLITGKNYMWNERFSKTNLLRKNPRQYNCLILGTSRSILLNPNKIEGYTCFNYSFALGTIGDYRNFLDYFLKLSSPPALVIVGVNTRDFVDRLHQPGDVPDYIRADSEPPSARATYLSYEALRFSIETLMGRSPHPIFYRSDFTGDIHPDSGPFHPESLLVPDLSIGMFAIDGFSTNSVRLFQQLRDRLPKHTRMIGYTPVISPHYVGRLWLDGKLEDYLWASYSVGQVFDKYYDFTMPSEWTKDHDLTYDGGHYDRSVNDKMAKVLSGGPLEAGLAVHGMSWLEYRDRFKEAVESYISDTGIQLSQARN